MSSDYNQDSSTWYLRLKTFCTFAVLFFWNFVFPDYLVSHYCWGRLSATYMDTVFQGSVRFLSRAAPFDCRLANLGAFHSTKISGLRFEDFLVSNGTRRVRTVSFHSTRKSHWNGACWITSARTRATWWFRRWYQWYCVSCFKRSLILRIVPRYLPYEFKHHFRTTKRTFQILLGNKSSLTYLSAVNSQNIPLACQAAPDLL